MHRWLKNGLVIALLLGTAFYALAEDITLITYYPSPRGVYQELTTTSNTYLATQGGNVGIGTATPTQKLEVNGALKLVSNVGGFPGPAIYASQGGGVLALTGSVNGFVFNNQADTANLVSITNTGNVGVGTVTPAAKLEVAGNVKMVDGNQADGKVLTSDANGVASWQFAIIPPGAVMFFDAAVCPPGWTELITAQGRYLVGAKPGATIGPAGVVGNDLNLAGGGLMENRPAGAHRHKETTYVSAGVGPPGGVIALPDAVFSTYAFTGAGPVRQLQIGTVQEVEGTNAPYMQLLVCRKD